MWKLKSNQENKNGYLWNSIAGLVNAGEAVILSMVVTRICSLSDAGIMAIAFAVGNLMMTIGKFGVRNFQATDVDEKFDFSDYFWTRIVTVAAMLAASLLYFFYSIQMSGYNSKKSVVILAICLIYAVESIEDVFGGFYQQRQELDIGAKVFILRWSVILAVFIVDLLFGHGLKEASAAGALACIFSFGIFNTIAFHSFRVKIHHWNVDSVKQILVHCFPLFAVAFLSFYVTNAPKYAIDKYLSQEVSACYSFISMPVFIIGLLNGFLYQPCLVQMALEWRGHQVKQLCERVKKQCMILAGLTAVCVSGAYVCGIPILSFLYGTELRTYKTELLILVLGGGMLAYAGYFGVLLTIMRRQDLILYGYAGAAFLALCFFHRIIKKYQIMGAVFFYTFLMSMLAVFFCLIYKREVYKQL